MSPRSPSAAMAGPVYNPRWSMSSRSSLRTMQTMSIITQYGDAYNPGALPKGPLRIPQRQSRRSMGPIYSPSPYVDPDRDTDVDISPTQEVQASPIKQIDASPSKEADAVPSKEVHVLPTKGVDAVPTKEADIFPTDEGDSDRTIAPSAPQLEESVSEDEERGWFAHRRRSSRFLILVGVAAIVIVALAVGLAVGLRKGGTTASAPKSSGSIFPAGSYALETSLRRASTGCTSRTSTWNCEPVDRDSATLYWDIRSRGPAAFTISSEQNRLTPSFSDLALELVDDNLPSERLVFFLPMTKVVAPSDGATPANRAAKCRYGDVVLRGTLFTRRRGSRGIPTPGRQEQHAAWPGDFEISQIMNSTIGQPTCVDRSGRQIADVQADQGTCECFYSN